MSPQELVTNTDGGDPAPGLGSIDQGSHLILSWPPTPTLFLDFARDWSGLQINPVLVSWEVNERSTARWLVLLRHSLHQASSQSETFSGSPLLSE